MRMPVMARARRAQTRRIGPRWEWGVSAPWTRGMLRSDSMEPRSAMSQWPLRRLGVMPGGGVDYTFVFSMGAFVTWSDGGGQRFCPADSDVEPAGSPVKLYVLRL